MTVGRTGSTWLINALAGLEGVAVPASNVPSRDNELIHHNTIPRYTALHGSKLKDASTLIEYFYHLNRGAKFAGFKSMPRRHPDYATFVQREDIQFITLDRRDFFATLASFLAATKHNTWRRTGGVPPKRLVYEPSDERQMKVNLGYVARGRIDLLQVPNAIRLYYEDLCQPGFREPKLDAFFEQAVVLEGAKPPTRTNDYVENEAEFRAAVDRNWELFRSKLPASEQVLLDSVQLDG